MSDTELLALRGQIDAIDDELIRLLKNRSQIVEKVGEYKVRQSKPGCFARPGREALIQRRIWESFESSSFSSHAALQMWRMIISSSTQIEADLRVLIAANDTASEYYWLAREYFGPFTPLLLEPNPTDIIANIMKGDAEIGILPCFTGASWWLDLALAGEGAPSIFARIPFVKRKTPVPHCFAIARLDPEPTGEDATLLAVETKEAIAHEMILQSIERDGSVWHLISLDGFDAPLDTLPPILHESMLQVKRLGAYALPIEVDR